MKKLSISIIAFITLSLTSCSSDDNNNNDTATVSLVGKWEFFQKGTIAGGIETLAPYPHTTGCSKDYLEFKSNNTFEDVWFENGTTGCITETQNGTWSINGNTLTTIYEGESAETIEIVILDASTLKVVDSSLDEDQTQVEVTVLKRL